MYESTLCWPQKCIYLNLDIRVPSPNYEKWKAAEETLVIGVGIAVAFLF